MATAQSNPATSDDSGKRLGDRYRLLHPLGAGAAGVVYAALDERLGAEVAIKRTRGAARADGTTLARLRLEAQAAGRIGHPNIVRVTDFGTDDEGSPFVVMEQLTGTTLADRIAAGPPLDLHTVLEIFVQLSDAVAAAHAAGVLHRDIKPGNVFVTSLATGKPLVKLVDFGLAELQEGDLSPRLTGQGLLVGSLGYLAPERLVGAEASVQSDVYALGVSLFESLTGELPFVAANATLLRAKILRGEASTLDAIRPELGPEIAALASAAMAREPEARIASAAELGRRLMALAHPASGTMPVGAATPARATSPAPAAPPESGDLRVTGTRRVAGAGPIAGRGRLGFAVALLLAIAIVLLLFSLRRPASPARAHASSPAASPREALAPAPPTTAASEPTSDRADQDRADPDRADQDRAGPSDADQAPDEPVAVSPPPSSAAAPRRTTRSVEPPGPRSGAASAPSAIEPPAEPTTVPPGASTGEPVPPTAGPRHLDGLMGWGGT